MDTAKLRVAILKAGCDAGLSLAEMGEELDNAHIRPPLGKPRSPASVRRRIPCLPQGYEFEVVSYWSQNQVDRELEKCGLGFPVMPPDLHKGTGPVCIEIPVYHLGWPDVMRIAVGRYDSADEMDPDITIDQVFFASRFERRLTLKHLRYTLVIAALVVLTALWVL